MKNLCLFLFLLSIVSSQNFPIRADLFEVKSFTGRVTVRGQPAFVGQPFNSAFEVKFSNCKTDQLVAKNIVNGVPVVFRGCLRKDGTAGVFRVKVSSAKDPRMLDIKEILSLPTQAIPFNAPELQAIPFEQFLQKH